MRNEQGQFETGLTPWNRGLKGIHLSPHSEWKKGRPAFNKKQKLKKVCEWCNKEFEVKPSYARLKCCSFECGQKNRFAHQAHPQTGKIRSAETREKQRQRKLGLRGPDHWNWRDGISRRQRHVEMQRDEYHEWRTQVFNRDNYKCQMCGSGGYLHAHHLKSWKDFPDFRYEVSNGQALCLRCHREVHKLTKKP